MPEGEQLSSECETEGVFYLRKKFIVDAKSKDEQHDHRQHVGDIAAHPHARRLGDDEQTYFLGLPKTGTPDTRTGRAPVGEAR